MGLTACVDFSFSDFCGPVGFSCFPHKTPLFYWACCTVHGDVHSSPRAFLIAVTAMLWHSHWTWAFNMGRHNIKKKNRTEHFIFVLWAPHISLSSINTGELYCFYLSLRLISCCCYLVPALSDVVWWSVAWCDTVLNVSKDILLSLCSTHAWDLRVVCTENDSCDR